MADGRQEGDDRRHGHGDDQKAPGACPKRGPARALPGRKGRSSRLCLKSRRSRPNGVRTQGRSFDLAKVIWYFSISNPYANADHDQDAF
jgi:hypothetical protein